MLLKLITNMSSVKRGLRKAEYPSSRVWGGRRNTLGFIPLPYHLHLLFTKHQTPTPLGILSSPNAALDPHLEVTQLPPESPWHCLWASVLWPFLIQWFSLLALLLQQVRVYCWCLCEVSNQHWQWSFLSDENFTLIDSFFYSLGKSKNEN